MEISNISHEYLDKVRQFLHKSDKLSNEAISLWVQNNKYELTKLLFVTETIWDNCCDPHSRNLKFKDELSGMRLWSFENAPDRYKQLYSGVNKSYDWVLFAPDNISLEDVKTALNNFQDNYDYNAHPFDDGIAYVTYH